MRPSFQANSVIVQSESVLKKSGFAHAGERSLSMPRERNRPRHSLSQLPAGMATELVYLMYKTVIDSTPFFEGLPRDVQTKLCLSMKPYPALAGDLVRSRHTPDHITIDAHTSGVARR